MAGPGIGPPSHVRATATIAVQQCANHSNDERNELHWLAVTHNGKEVDDLGPPQSIIYVLMDAVLPVSLHADLRERRTRTRPDGK